MVKIAYLIPGVGITTEEIERRERIANQIVTDEVRVIEAESGPLSIENTVEENWSHTGLLRLLGEVRDSYDAFVIGCFGDPAIHALREMTDKPIVGPAQSSFHTACQLGDRFACITILDSTEPLTRRLVEKYKLDGRLAGVPVVNAPVLDIDHSSGELVNQMVNTGKEVVENERADVIVPGCMSLSFMQVHDEIAERIGVPFIDPVTVSLETASMWARHGLTHSSSCYTEPNWEKLENLI